MVVVVVVVVVVVYINDAFCLACHLSRPYGPDFATVAIGVTILYSVLMCRPYEPNFVFATDAKQSDAGKRKR